MRKRSSPWGAIVALVSAVVLAAPTILLPSDGPTGHNAAFAVGGAVLLLAAIVLTRREQGARPPGDSAGSDEVSPPEPGSRARK